MNKIEFLDGLRVAMKGISQSEIEDRILFYGEMIDDRVEEGVSEEEAVRGIGSVEEVAAQIISEVPLGKLVKERVRPRRKLQTWEIVLIAVGSPVWCPLLIAALAVVFTLVVSVYAVVVSLWAVAVALVAAGVGCVAATVLFMAQGNILTGIYELGTGLFLLGFSVFFFFGCKALTRWLVVLTKKSLRAIKICLVGRRESK